MTSSNNGLTLFQPSGDNKIQGGFNGIKNCNA